MVSHNKSLQGGSCDATTSKLLTKLGELVPFLVLFCHGIKSRSKMEVSNDTEVRI